MSKKIYVCRRTFQRNGESQRKVAAPLGTKESNLEKD
jgi:hypothetical protein